MTNGEKIKEIFPDTKIITQYDNPFGDRFIVFTLNNEDMQVNIEWWNAEYQEPSSSEKPNKSIEEKCPCYHCEYFEIKGWSHCKIHEDAYGDSRCNDYRKVNQDLNKVNQGLNKSEIPTGSTNTISFKEMTDNLKITAEDIENAEDLEYFIEPLVHPKNDSGVREFEEIVVEYPPEDLCTYPEYKGKPYFSIKYKEGNDCFIGYGTYSPKVFSRFLRDYFMPSVTPQEPRWIPISERLPQENERVLVTIQTPHRTSVRSGIFFYPFFSIDNGDCWRFNEEEVVAWMSLPKPYREVEE
jgi:hypothetical protein